HYKRSKYLAEQLVRDSAQTGVPAVIVNPSTPIGPGDVKPTPTGRIVLDAASGRMPAYVDTGLNLVHVDDVAAGHLLAFERGRIGPPYILRGPGMSLARVPGESDARGGACACRAVGGGAPPRPGRPPAALRRAARGDISRGHGGGAVGAPVR